MTHIVYRQFGQGPWWHRVWVGVARLIVGNNFVTVIPDLSSNGVGYAYGKAPTISTEVTYHEEQHVAQWMRMGILKYFLKYLSPKGRMELELEAYAAQYVLESYLAHGWNQELTANLATVRLKEAMRYYARIYHMDTPTPVQVTDAVLQEMRKPIYGWT